MKNLLTIILAVLALNSVYAQPGKLDFTFINPTYPSIQFINEGDWAGPRAIQSDGKIILCGRHRGYYSAGYPARKYPIIRLQQDGNIDNEFKANLDNKDKNNAIALQSDGRIVLGQFYYNDNNWDVAHGIRSLFPNGTIEFSSFLNANDEILTVATQNDGKIILGGRFTTYAVMARNHVVRLGNNGSIDLEFDPGTGADTTVNTIALQSDGKIIIGGEFSLYNGTARKHIARLFPDGSLDTDFDPGSGSNGPISAIALQSDGKIIIAGEFSVYNGAWKNRIARLNSDGSLDTDFSPGTSANRPISAIALQSDGKIIIGGEFTVYNGVKRNYLARLNPDGSLDTLFNNGDGPNGLVNSILMQSDGKIIIGGEFTLYDGVARDYIARIHGDNTRGTKPNDEDTALKVYPNPAGETLNFELQESDNVTISNMSGDIFFRQNFNIGINTIDISLLVPGPYTLRSAKGKRAMFIKK